MKIFRAMFVVVGSFVMFSIVGFWLGVPALALIVWAIFATIGVYQICREKPIKKEE